MRRPDLAVLLGAAITPLALSGCLGVTDQHSVQVRQVPVELLFRSTPTPSVAPLATPAAALATPSPPKPTPTPGAAR